jgi:hypothetical protein
MATNEDTLLSQYSTGFRANLNLAPQEKDLRLVPVVDAELAYDAPGQMFNADDVQTSDPEPIVARVPNTPDKFVAQVRRIGYFLPYNDAAWIDNLDKARELEDPTSRIMEALMAGHNRYRDIQCLVGLLGPAYAVTGAIGTTGGVPSSVSFPSSQVVASTDVTYQPDSEVLPTDGSQYGMSVAKLLHAKLLLEESELEGQMHLACTAYQLADLCRRTPATSRYYVDTTALRDGKIDEFLGFKFHRLNSTIFKKAGLNIGYTLGHDGASPIYNCPAWVERAVVYKGRPIITATLARRADKSHRLQAYYEGEHGAVRRYDTAVVNVQCYTGAAY